MGGVKGSAWPTCSWHAVCDWRSVPSWLLRMLSALSILPATLGYLPVSASSNLLGVLPRNLMILLGTTLTWGYNPSACQLKSTSQLRLENTSSRGREREVLWLWLFFFFLNSKWLCVLYNMRVKNGEQFSKCCWRQHANCWPLLVLVSPWPSPLVWWVERTPVRNTPTTVVVCNSQCSLTSSHQPFPDIEEAPPSKGKTWFGAYWICCLPVLQSVRQLQSTEI